MAEEKIIKQLSEIRSFLRPSEKWKADFREQMMCQISGSADFTQTNKFSKATFEETALRVKFFFAQPVAVVLTILVLVSGTSLAGLRVARDTKPGDSLYIAKRISEKAQYSLTFNDLDRAKLNLEFASQRAKEIEQVLANQEETPNKASQVEDLEKNFKKEIETAKNKLAKISTASPVSIASRSKNEPSGQPAKDTVSEVKLVDQPIADEEPVDSVFSADFKRDQTGIQINDSGITVKSETDNSAKGEDVTTTEPAAGAGTGASTVKASTTPDEPKELDDDSLASADPNQALTEAEELFDKNDFQGTVDKLEEVNAMIDTQKIDSAYEAGEVKGASETATGSPDDKSL